MGFFKRSPEKVNRSLAARTFYVPATPAEALDAILSSGDIARIARSGVRPHAGLQEDIRMSALGHDSFTLTAGNRVQTYWAYHVHLRPEGSGAAGEIIVENHSNEAYPRWAGDIVAFTDDIERLLTGSGGKKRNWPY